MDLDKNAHSNHINIDDSVLVKFLMTLFTHS
jgi:hypothetical protein